jgi:hypothetical protein
MRVVVVGFDGEEGAVVMPGTAIAESLSGKQWL